MPNSKSKKKEGFGDWKQWVTKEVTQHIITQSKKLPKGKPDSLRDSKIWLSKNLSSLSKKFNELYGTEFIRMILDPKGTGRCSKARIMEDKKGQLQTIVSMIQFTPLAELKPETFKKDILEEKKRGIGETTTILAFLAAKDPHTDNIGIGIKNSVVAIDLEDAFQDSSSKYSISPELIQSLPSSKKVPNFHPYNWFGETTKGISTPEESYIAKTFSKASNIEHEKYITILKMCVLPKDLIKEFLGSYTNLSTIINYYSDFFIERQMHMLGNAFEVEIFREYFISNTAENDLDAYLNELKEFKTMKHHYLLGSPPDTTIKTIKEQFFDYRSRLQSALDEMNNDKKLTTNH